jgi:hypothetical protein
LGEEERVCDVSGVALAADHLEQRTKRSRCR